MRGTLLHAMAVPPLASAGRLYRGAGGAQVGLGKLSK